MPQVVLSDLITDLRDSQNHYVDSRTWEGDWSESWIGFSDVTGFASRCRRSEQAVVNSIVRFHRSVASAVAACGQSSPRLFRFTDAVYAVSPTLGDVLRFSSNLQHECLAQNAVMLNDKEHPLAHHMLLVRTTVAYGRVLTLDGAVAPEARTLGVDQATLLAGEGIVKAYELEKRTVGGLISLRIDDDQPISAEIPTIRGRLGRSRSILERWAGQQEGFTHDGVIDLPWTLLRPRQVDDDLWAASTAEARRKLLIQLDVASLMGGEFLMGEAPLAVAKHQAGLKRHLNEAAQRLEGHRQLRHWTEERVRTALEQ